MYQVPVLGCSVLSFVWVWLWPQGLQPTRLLHPWDLPGKNTGVGCIFSITPGDLPNPGMKPASLVSPALAGRFFSTAPAGKPVLSFQGWHDKLSQTAWLKAADVYCLIVLDNRPWSESVSRVLFSPKPIGENLFLSLHSFWWFASDPECSLACSREHFCCCLCFMSSHDTLLSHLFLLFLKRHQLYWFQVHLNPVWSYYSLILSVKILFPSKIFFTGNRG